MVTSVLVLLRTEFVIGTPSVLLACGTSVVAAPELVTLDPGRDVGWESIELPRAPEVGMDSLDPETCRALVLSELVAEVIIPIVLGLVSMMLDGVESTVSEVTVADCVDDCPLLLSWLA